MKLLMIFTKVEKKHIDVKEGMYVKDKKGFFLYSTCYTKDPPNSFEYFTCFSINYSFLFTSKGISHFKSDNDRK
jgi:hypothetical protein